MCGVALDQHVVRVDGAVEEDLVAEVGLELPQVHAAAAGLHGVQAVQPDLDHRRNQLGEPAAAVQHDLQAVGVAQVDQPLRGAAG